MGRLKPNFIWRLHKKFVQIILVTWPRLSQYPYMLKTFENLLLWNRLADVQSLFKWWPYVDLWPLYANANFIALYIWIENTEIVAETIEVYDIKVDIYSQLNGYMEIYMYQRSRSFFDLCLRSLRFYWFQTAFVLKQLNRLVKLHMNHSMTKWPVRPVRTEIRLDESEPSLSAWRNLGSFVVFRAHSEGSN